MYMVVVDGRKGRTLSVSVTDEKRGCDIHEGPGKRMKMSRVLGLHFVICHDFS